MQTSTPVTESLRLRVALAFIILRHKPKDLSLDAYILDLRQRFPQVGNSEQNAENGKAWRERALKFEARVKELTRKLEQEHNKLETLRASMQSTSDTTQNRDIPPKKKRKTDMVNNTQSSSSSLVQEITYKTPKLNKDLQCPELIEPLHLLCSYYELSALSTNPRQEGLSKLLKSTNSVLEAISRALSIVSLSQGSPEIKDYSRIVKDLCWILRQVLGCIISSVPSSSKKMKTILSDHEQKQLDTNFATLTFDIVIPLIKSFSRFTTNMYLSSLLKTNFTKKPQSQVATSETCFANLELLKSVVRLAKEQKGHSLCLKWSEFLETVRMSAVMEVKNLWESSNANKSGTSSSEPSGTLELASDMTREERILRLARKDTLWYLSSIIHDTFPLTPATNTGLQENSADEIKRNNLETALSSLLTRYSIISGSDHQYNLRKKDVMDTVEKGMIAAIIERLWLQSDGRV